MLQRITSDHFPRGYTILDAAGGWFDPKARRFIREESRQILVGSASSVAIRRWARALGKAFRQKELLVAQLGKMHRITVPRGSR